MYLFFRSLLFKLDPETAHALTLNALRLSGLIPPVNWTLAQLFKPPQKPVEAFGLTFKNPVGLAAGYDKDGLALRGLASLGFGHIEIGTVTPRPQPGNPSPRVFRLVEDEAVINRMGFPSRGSEYVQGRLNTSLARSWQERLVGLSSRKPAVARQRPDAILGVNIGKNKETPNEEAVLDYLALLQSFAPLADYLAINVSSPNTMGLRRLQGREALEGLLSQLHAQRIIEQRKLQRRVPLLVKLAPDLSDPELNDAIDVILSTGMDGVIVTNTTLSRAGLASAQKAETGGLSGKPLRALADGMLEKVVARVNGRVAVVAAGGIMNPQDAKRKLELGATLVQVYTGLIYAGPGLVKQIVRSL
jgi:dihydroorotate dehydrogenase